MNYTINDTNQLITITLTTDHTVYPILNTYINDKSTIAHKYSPINNSSPYIYQIPTSDYELGDRITNAEFSQDTPIYPWQTDEGLTVLLDGVEVPVGKVENDTPQRDENGYMVTEDKLKSNKFYLNFEEQGTHKIQAVYVGNNALNMSSTSKETFTVQTEPSETPVVPSGAYKLEFYQTKLNDISYDDGTVITFRLTRGGVPVPNATIQRVYGDGYDATTTTNSKGLCSMKVTASWGTGKKKIGAKFYDPIKKKVITSTYKTINIKKRTPTLTDNYKSDGEFVVNSKYVAVLKSKNSPITKKKVDVYVNGKKTTLKTDSKGQIEYKFPAKNTYNLKCIFKGDDINTKLEWSRTFTIKE